MNDSRAAVLSQGQKLRQKIEERTGFPLSDLRHYAIGQNANLYLIDLTDDRRMLAKIMRTGDDVAGTVTLEPEGWMLDYLARKSKLPVPKVHWYDATTILMDFIEDSGPMDATAQESAAELLAGLHTINGDFFGLERDTTISAFTQPNPYEVSWVTFFRDQRLLFAAREALKEGIIQPPLMKKIEQLAARLEGFIGNSSKPSLIHGDLWGGNILLGQGKVNAFLDPAMYFADPEIELAFISHYDTFGEPFFRRYHDIRPIQKGFQDIRRHIYSLYPLLIGARGGTKGKVAEIEGIVDKFT